MVKLEGEFSWMAGPAEEKQTSLEHPIIWGEDLHRGENE